MMLSFGIIIFCVLAEIFGRAAMRGHVSFSYNTGAAFGLMSSSSEMLIWLGVAANIIVACVLIFWKPGKWVRVGLSLMLGGAVSNLAERILLGHVVDWLPVPFTALRFNLSDVFIALGAVLTFIMISSSRR